MNMQSDAQRVQINITNIWGRGTPEIMIFKVIKTSQVSDIKLHVLVIPSYHAVYFHKY